GRLYRTVLVGNGEPGVDRRGREAARNLRESPEFARLAECWRIKNERARTHGLPQILALRVPETGIEPARPLRSPGPQPGASASSATPARCSDTGNAVRVGYLTAFFAVRVSLVHCTGVGLAWLPLHQQIVPALHPC